MREAELMWMLWLILQLSDHTSLKRLHTLWSLALAMWFVAVRLAFCIVYCNVFLLLICFQIWSSMFVIGHHVNKKMCMHNAYTEKFGSCCWKIVGSLEAFPHSTGSTLVTSLCSVASLQSPEKIFLSISVTKDSLKYCVQWEVHRWVQGHYTLYIYHPTCHEAAH